MSSLIKSKGEEAAKRAENNNSGTKLKDVLIKVPKGSSVRVRILGAYDYAEWDAHGLFKKINTTPCIKPTGQECPYCQFHEEYIKNLDKDSDEYKTLNQLRAQPRYLMVFGVLETGQLGVFDASKAQFKALNKTIKKNSEPDEDGEVAINHYAFDLTRTDEEKSNYSLELVPKLTKADKEKFDKFNGVTIPDDFFESLLVARSAEQMLEDLKAAGIADEWLNSRGADATANPHGF